MIPIAAVLLAAVLVTPADSFVLVQDGKCITDGAPANNKAVKARFEGDFFWFTRGGEEFIVRDEATLRTVRKMHDPIFDSLGTLGYTAEQLQIFVRQMEVLREQARVGLDDAALKAEQARLGRRQSELARLANRAARNAVPPEKLNAEISRSLATLANDLIARGVARRVTATSRRGTPTDPS